MSLTRILQVKDSRAGKVTLLILSLLAFFSLTITAQEDWNEATINRGKIEVKYRISERINQEGQWVPLIEFVSRTVERISFDQCVSLMMDIDRHKDLLDAERSEIISTQSENQWTTYYVYPSAGPIAASDAVMDFRYLESADGRTAVFTFDAVPQEFPLCGMDRVSYDHEIYQFNDLGNGEVEIIVEIHVTPAMDVPQWMLNMAFPSAGGDIIKNIINLAS